MRNSIILPNNLELLFIHEAEKSGLIKSIYNLADELYDEYDLLDAEAKFNRFLDRKSKR